MEQLSKSGQYLFRVCEELMKKMMNLNDPKNALIIGVSTFVSILAIFISWRFTHRKQYVSPVSKCIANKVTEKRKATALTAVNKRANSSEDTVELDSQRDSGNESVSASDEMARLPPGCPLTQMYHLSKMSQVSAALNKDSQPEAREDGSDSELIDNPEEYMSHIQSQVKRSQQRATIKRLEQDMSQDQKEKERDTQREQLEAIYKMMETQQDKFGITDMDEMQSQIKMYM